MRLYVTDIEDVDVTQTTDGGNDLIVVSAKEDSGPTIKLRLSLDVAEALQYALEQVLR